MTVAIELSGEHATLPRAEATALVEQAGARVLEADLDRVLLAEGDLDTAVLAKRIALARRIVDVQARTPRDVEAIVATAERITLDGARFAVRCSRLDPDIDPSLVQTIERRLGAALADEGTVDLDSPEVTVRVLLAQEAIVGPELATVDRASYQDRHVEARPFFSPVSLDPRLARCLVNLARVAPGDRVWDPFVGTGGIALEAALVGAETIVSDLDEAMLTGTTETLAHFDLAAEAHQGDIEAVAERIEPVDAIVTDPPYGRASTTNKEAIGDLYDRFLATAARMLPPGGSLVCVLPDPAEADRAPAELTLVGEHAWYVHASLTRNVLVFRRDP